ncbi:MAG: metallophosphoesterase [Candidatus Aenigmarchaeota archaeon]|nr:metallophosphoesterase [Candidatus Aenigmarchaeota archaeon]
MKFLCSSDFHGVVPIQMKEIAKQHNINAILAAGDFSPHGWHGEGESAEGPLRFLISLGLPVFCVHGNIDPSPDYFLHLEKMYKNFHYVHLKRVKMGDYYIVGIGDFYFMSSYVLDKFEELLKKNPKKTIVISHYPPLGILDKSNLGNHAGSEELRNLIEKYQPLLFLCGHIHESAGVGNIGRTTVINAAMKNVLVEIEDEEVNVSLV